MLCEIVDVINFREFIPAEFHRWIRVSGFFFQNYLCISVCFNVSVLLLLYTKEKHILLIITIIYGFKFNCSIYRKCSITMKL